MFFLITHESERLKQSKKIDQSDVVITYLSIFPTSLRLMGVIQNPSLFLLGFLDKQYIFCMECNFLAVDSSGIYEA